MLNKIKDFASAKAAMLYFNKNFKNVGTMTDLKIDSKNCTISLALNLKGEVEPIAFVVNNYTLSTETGSTYIQISEIESSCEWINVLLAEFVSQKRFEVPPAVSAVL